MRHLEPPFVEPHIASIFVDEGEAELASNPVADVVAKYGGERGAGDHAVDIHAALTGERGGGEQDRLSRHGDSGALQRDDAEHGEISVMR